MSEERMVITAKERYRALALAAIDNITVVDEEIPDRVWAHMKENKKLAASMVIVAVKHARGEAKAIVNAFFDADKKIDPTLIKADFLLGRLKAKYVNEKNKDVETP